MTNSLCKTSVAKAYQDVINDVTTNIREYFVEDGVDEAVLQELKQLWETKLCATKAVDENKEPEHPISVNNKASLNAEDSNNAAKNSLPMMPQQMPHHHQQQHVHQQLMQQNKQFLRQLPFGQHVQQTHNDIVPMFPDWRRVPIQLTIPSAPGLVGDGNRILSINVPEVFLQGHHLKSILTGQVIGTTLGLPLARACAFLQEQVNQAFLKYQQQYFGINDVMNPPFVDSVVQELAHVQNIQNLHNIPQIDGAVVSAGEIINSLLQSPVKDLQPLPIIPQKDGPADSDESAEDEDDKSEEGSDNDMNEDKEEEDELETGSPEVDEGEPLNSEDDVSDAEGLEESFETDNVIVCQYDKITRSRNRWKFHLKDGIMNLNGEDFIFQKANGDAEW